MLLESKTELEGLFEKYPFFSSEEKQRIVDSTVCRTLKKGDTVFREGQTPNGLVFLSQGKAKVYKKGVSGKEQIVRLAKPWSMIGFQAYLSGDDYIASAKTLEPSVVCHVDHACVSDLLKSNMVFSNAMLQSVSRALRHSDSRLLALTQKHVRARLADSLMLLAGTYGLHEDGRTLDVNLSREDLAKLSNMTASNATRTLADFQKEGLIQLGERRTIHLLNIPAITRVSENG